jgi:hypothetical protein
MAKIQSEDVEADTSEAGVNEYAFVCGLTILTSSSSSAYHFFAKATTMPA